MAIKPGALPPVVAISSSRTLPAGGPEGETLLRLGEEHEDAGAAVGLESIALFLKSARRGETIAILVCGGFAVHEQHVMMRLVSRDVVHGDVPRIQNAVLHHLDSLPVIEGAEDFHCFGLFGMAIRKTPAKNLAVGGVAAL